MRRSFPVWGPNKDDSRDKLFDESGFLWKEINAVIVSI